MGTSPEEQGRVLVVDDDDAMRAFESTVLRASGFEVLAAASAEEALELLAGNQVDVVLLDNRLPGMSGVEALTQLRATPGNSTLPVILVTADDEVGARVAGLHAGADDYVIKPFSPEELVARVGARIRERTAWDDVVAAHLDERAGVARVLRAAAADGGVETRAGALCDSMCELRTVAGAALFLFEGDATATVLAVAGDAPWVVERGQILPPQTARYLSMRAIAGPWIDGRDLAEATGLLENATAACAPVGHRELMTGVLALVPSSEAPSDVNTALATGIDFATMIEGLLRNDLTQRGRDRRRRFQIEQVLREGSFVPHFQPIVDLRDGHLPVVGVEALTRFADGMSPDARFRFAASCGLGVELERMTLDRALTEASNLTDSGWVSVNVSPTFLLQDDGFAERLAAYGKDVVLELSEQEQVADYTELKERVRSLGAHVHLSVDDAGSGFASLRHILLLQPEYVKLDRTWVTKVDTDPARQSLIAGLVHFSITTGCRLIAEGIETDAERQTLADLGVQYGQGYLLGFPQPSLHR